MLLITKSKALKLNKNATWNKKLKIKSKTSKDGDSTIPLIQLVKQLENKNKKIVPLFKPKRFLQ